MKGVNMDYQIEIKQIVDYPRCRIYRNFLRDLMEDRNIRTNGSSYLFYYMTLCSFGMFVALDYVWDKAKEDRTAEKAIFIDEVWQLIGSASNQLAAEFVVEIFKIIRGYGGSAICATQDLNDFFSKDDGKYGKGIINNCKTKIVLNLEDEEAVRVQDVLHLSEAETMAIKSFERGNGLISTNNNNVTVEFKASALETELITTDREELKRLLEREKQRHHLSDAS